MENNCEQILELLVKNIVLTPEEVEITRQVDEMGVLLEVKVKDTEVGLIIGRGGATAQSIRRIIKTIGLKNKQRINIRIKDPRQQFQPRKDEDLNFGI